MPATTVTGGRLALCSCPGKQNVSRAGTVYCRDLDKDLDALKHQHGVDVLVCLLPEAELRYLKVRGYAEHVAARGIEYIHLPIIEMAPPHDLQVAAECVDSIVQRLQDGRTVAMHCKGGIGRAGTMAACVLLRLGVCHGATDAIGTVRQFRRGAVESRKQEDFVKRYAQWLVGSAVGVWVQQGAPAAEVGWQGAAPTLDGAACTEQAMGQAVHDAHGSTRSTRERGASVSGAFARAVEVRLDSRG